ncbi:MAG: phospholipase D family protein [Holophagae bacterium]
MQVLLRATIAAVSLCLIAACASLPEYELPLTREVPEPDPTSRFGRLASELAGQHGPGVSGFAAIDANGDALKFRLAVIDSAERSLDMLYYLWYRDPSGLLMLEHTIKAAERGVSVRIVVDDALFVKGKRGLANLDAHPNIEVRIFNPWVHRGVGRLFESVSRMKKLNHRMHNKLLIADNRTAILGGRNIGDHYFGLHHKYNFHDLDVIVLGDAATRSSEIFDHFWKSERVYAASAFVDDPSWDTVEAVRREELDALRTNDDVAAFPIERRDWTDELSSLVARMSPGTATPEYDRLDGDSPRPTSEGSLGLADLVDRAQSEVLVVNAYIIPGDRMMEILRDAHERGVRVRVLTNSLASNDVPAVTAKYKKHRKPLLEAGVELFEFRAHPEIQPGIVDTPPVEAGFSGLHTKMAVIDREHVYFGSLNLDPRSIRLNTEMGLIVTSPELAEQVAAIAERDMSPANSWRVRVDDEDQLIWESDAGTATRQPAQSTWQRLQAWFFKILPEGQL